MAQGTARTRGGSGGSAKGDGGSGDGGDFPEGLGAADGEVGTAYLDGVTFRSKAVQYVVVDGLAMLEGDICLGNVEDVRAITEMRREELTSAEPMASGVIISGDTFRWPDCRVPYQVASDLANQARVTDAIAHWEARTRFRFVPRSPANAAQFPDWVDFVTGTGCSSFVGRRGGRQEVRLAPACGLGNTIHEIGHVVGLWHEQSREDRDAFVRIEFANINPSAVHNFTQHITDGDDNGGYDYGSIMHYPRTAFSRNGLDTVVPLTAGVTIGQRTALSAGDVAAANSMCRVPKPPFKEAAKDPIKEVVKELRKDGTKDSPKDLIKESPKDGVKDSPKDFIKEIRKDGIKDNPKEFVKEVRKEFAKEFPKDRIKESVFDRGKSLAADLPGNPGGPVTLPPFRVGRQPFVLATGEEAGGEAVGPAGAGDGIDELLQVLAEYSRLDAMGVLGPEDRASWQQAATYAQQLLADEGQ